jgi:hypothetical protein
MFTTYVIVTILAAAANAAAAGFDFARSEVVLAGRRRTSHRWRAPARPAPP